MNERKAFVLSPRDPFSGIWYLHLGYAEFCRDAAIEQLKRAIVSGQPTYVTYAFLAGAEAAKGRDAEAKSAWRRRVVSIRNSRSNLLRRRYRLCRSLSMACARPGFRKNERSTVFRLSDAMRQRRTQPM